MKQIVGIYDKANKNFGFVIPDNTKIHEDVFVPVERSKGAVSGHKVVCEITDYGKNNRKPEERLQRFWAMSMTPAWILCRLSRAMSFRLNFLRK